MGVVQFGWYKKISPARWGWYIVQFNYFFQIASVHFGGVVQFNGPVQYIYTNSRNALRSQAKRPWLQRVENTIFQHHLPKDCTFLIRDLYRILQSPMKIYPSDDLAARNIYTFAPFNIQRFHRSGSRQSSDRLPTKYTLRSLAIPQTALAVEA